MDKRIEGRGICNEIENFHTMQAKKKTGEAVKSLRRICELKGFIIDKSKYCELYGRVAPKPMEVDERAKREILVRITLSDRTAEVKLFMVIPLDINVNSFKEMIHKYYGFPPCDQIFLSGKEKRNDDFSLNHETLKPVKNQEGFYDVHVYLKDALLRKRKQEGQLFNTEKVVRGMAPKDTQRKRGSRRLEEKVESPQPRPKASMETHNRERTSLGSRDNSARRHRETSFQAAAERPTWDQRQRAQKDDRFREQRPQQSNSRRSRHDAEIAKQMQMEEYEDGATTVLHQQQQEFKDVQPTQGRGGIWICPLCTFENQDWRPGCEQCSTDKP